MSELQTQLDRIEAAIQSNHKSISERMNTFDARLSMLERKEESTVHELRTVTETVKELIKERGAVLRRKAGAIVLDKERVYNAANAAGYSRIDFLRELEEAGVLEVKQGIPKRYTRKVRIDGRSIRTVVIINLD